MSIFVLIWELYEMKKLPERPNSQNSLKKKYIAQTMLYLLKIKFVAKNFLTKKTPSSCEFSGDFYQILREGITLILEIFFPQKWKRMEYFPIYFMNPMLT